MKKMLRSALTLTVSSLVTVGAANAQNGDVEACYASEVIVFDQGLKTNGTPVAAARSNPELALGQPDASNAAGGFVSLGYNGSITLGFDGVVHDLPGNDLLVFETSFSGNNCGFGDDESAEIELSQDGNVFISVGVICRDGEIDIADSGLEYISQIRITSTESTNTSDGYDLDGIVAINGCAPLLIEEGCFASESLAYNPGLKNNGQPITDANRIDPTKALGAPQLDDTFNFVSLGYGGELVLGFDGAVLNGDGDDILVAETTFGNNTFETYAESADVLVSRNGTDFFYVGSITTKEAATFDISDAGQGFGYIIAVKIVDTTPEGSVSDDAFDVDGVEALNGCGPIPLIEEGDCYATESILYVAGTRSNGNALPANRIDENKALGEPEGTDANVFVTLGYGGSIILGFDGAVLNNEGADIAVIETSFGNQGCAAYREYADVYVSLDGIDFHFAKTVCKSDNLVDIADAGDFDFINFVKLVNNDVLTTTGDGFDLDGVIALHSCENDQPEIVDPFCTNETVYNDHDVVGEIVRLTAMGYYLEDGLYGFRWRIRNETGAPQSVTYEFAGSNVILGQFDLEIGEEVLFTSGFSANPNGGGTMIIRDLDGAQWNVKAHGGEIKDLADCSELENELPALQIESAELTAYPNPSTGPVVIEFSTPVAQTATLEVMDMSGRTVATIFNQTVEAGLSYRVDFNGMTLPNGIYITKLTTENETVVEKLMIAR